jgi:hypothetical protein
MKSMAWVLVAAAAAGCGGKGGGEATTPDEPAGDATEEPSEEPADDGTATGDMLPPDQLDAIQRALDRKRLAASRCLTDAMEAGEVEKGSRGRVTLNFVIGTDGAARDIKVDDRSLKSDSVRACVVDIVGKIGFPALPRAVDWSYTYAFEAY